MNPFEQLLQKVYDGDPDKATEDIMSALKLSKYQREVLRYVVREGVGRMLGNEARRLVGAAVAGASAEDSQRKAWTAYARKAAEAPLPEYTPPRDKFELTLPELRALLPVEFVLAGRRISWAEATINDHRAAETARRQVARSHLVHADRHAQAIKALERSGCDTLGELFTRQAAA